MLLLGCTYWFKSCGCCADLVWWWLLPPAGDQYPFFSRTVVVLLCSGRFAKAVHASIGHYSCDKVYHKPLPLY